jgi:hypothetical protein
MPQPKLVVIYPTGDLALERVELAAVLAAQP